jgi:hypothetical protein
MAKNNTTPKKATGNKPTTGVTSALLVAPGSPAKYRARVRMYRQGLGDCFLVTFPREGKKPFQILIDCGVLVGDAQSMTQIVEHIRDTVRDGKGGKAHLDLVVATHEHKDHLSGFNQAREVFSQDFDFGAVWLGWTENLTQPEIKKIKEAKKKAVTRLRAALNSPAAKIAGEPLDGVAALLAFSEDDDTPGSRTIADALEYLKFRGKAAGKLQYLDPGTGPLHLDDVEVTEQMKKEGVIYHLASTGEAGMNALSAALSAADAVPNTGGDRFYPFAGEHRITPQVPDPFNPGILRPNPYFDNIRSFVAGTYDDPTQDWRRIDHDWLNAFGQLALDLDSDTNNTSLVLAFEFVQTGEVLLFVGDAQVGNWQSWANVEFKLPDRDKPLPAHDLLNRTVFYKVGHHCSHNATLKKGGLELMIRDDLVAFIPLDREIAANQGKKDPITLKPKGWEMPAGPLYKALLEKANKRVVISDVKEDITPEAKQAGVIATDTYIDYFLR